MPARTRAHALIRFTDALRKRVNEMGLTLVEAMDRFVASGGGRTSFLLYWEGKEPPKYNKSFNRLSVAFGVDFRPYLEYNKSTRGLIARRPRFDA
jgi:hypothetical protein